MLPTLATSHRLRLENSRVCPDSGLVLNEYEVSNGPA